MTSGTKIRLLREQKGWGQEVLADHLNISQPAISKIESDQTKLSWDHAVQLGILFEVDPEYFFDSKVNNYISHNEIQNQLFNSEYIYNNLDLVKSLYEDQIKAKDELLSVYRTQIEELKAEIDRLKK